MAHYFSQFPRGCGQRTKVEGERRGPHPTAFGINFIATFYNNPELDSLAVSLNIEPGRNK